MDLLQHASLKSRDAVRQENVGTIAKIGREDGIKRGENIEMNFQRIPRVHVLVITAFPAKGLARLSCEPTGVNASLSKDLAILSREILTDDANQSGRRKETCRI